MAQRVQLKIFTEQCYQGAERVEEETNVEGLLEGAGVGWRIAYREPETTGMGDTLTEFLVGDGVTLRRSGDVSSEMTFRSSPRPIQISYGTPYGELPLSIWTKALDERIDERGGELDVRYAVYVAHRLSHEIHFHVTVVPIKR